MLWQERCPVFSFWRREKMWALKTNMLAPHKKKTTVSSTLSLPATALLTIVEGRGTLLYNQV